MASEVHNAYDRWAAQYDTDANDTRDLNAQMLRGQKFFREDDTILEIGCGTGLNTEWLAEQVGSVVATDVSEGMLDRARQRLDLETVTLQQMDVMEPWPFDDNAFDCVVSTLVLEHVEALGPIFREARRTLKNGGAFYVSELHPYRQMKGTQAHFEDEANGETVVIEAFMHPVSEFVNEGVRAGFLVQQMGEWQIEKDDDPRLLSIQFRANAVAGEG